MIILTDTFNSCIISRHRTIAAAIRARNKHARDLVRRNGPNHYVWYSITDSSGADISEQVYALDY